MVFIHTNHTFIPTLPHYACCRGLKFRLINVTLVVPEDELLFLTAAFGPNATANSGKWVTQPSAGYGCLDAAPVRGQGGGW